MATVDDFQQERPLKETFELLAAKISDARRLFPPILVFITCYYGLR